MTRAAGPPQAPEGKNPCMARALGTQRAMTGIELATFAAGCFWHVEKAFWAVRGVRSTTAGYTGGHSKNPTYEEVHTGRTGHAESVRIEFDTSVVSYARLLDVFWSMHDPTQLDRQGPDIGTQYRSAIFYHNEMQRDIAISSRGALQRCAEFRGRRIVTKTTPAADFWPAEDYHQKYLQKHSRAGCGL